MNKLLIGVAVVVVLGIGGWAWYTNSQSGAMTEDSNAMHADSKQDSNNAMHDSSTGDSMHAEVMASTSDTMHASGDAMMH